MSDLGSRASNQRVKRTADPEPAMSSIRGVMLLPISAKSYRSHTAHHAFINKLSGSTPSANRPIGHAPATVICSPLNYT
jgi:fatty acid desaturase